MKKHLIRIVAIYFTLCAIIISACLFRYERKKFEIKTYLEKATNSTVEVSVIREDQSGARINPYVEWKAINGERGTINMYGRDEKSELVHQMNEVENRNATIILLTILASTSITTTYAMYIFDKEK